MSHLNFSIFGTTPSGKTRIWNVKSVGPARPLLGTVKWYAPWRKYVFEPLSQTIYDAACLTEISQFCVQQTAEHKA